MNGNLKTKKNKENKLFIDNEILVEVSETNKKLPNDNYYYEDERSEVDL